MKPRAEEAGLTWLLFLAAPLVWFAHFSALYGIAAFANLPGDGLLGFDAIAWTLTGLACLAVGAAWRQSRRSKWRSRSKPDLSEMAGWLALLSSAGIVFQG
jgi:hypothetical protein